VVTLQPHRTLVVKVFLIAFLNLILLTILFAIFVRIQYRADIDSFLLTPAHDRILPVGREAALDLRETDSAGWDNLLAQHAALHAYSSGWWTKCRRCWPVPEKSFLRRFPFCSFLLQRVTIRGELRR
jgi:hypothetical protein